MIELKKPLAFFDLETTGLDVTNDRIVEIGIVKMNPDGTKETYDKRVNPEMDIPDESSAIHGITNEDIKDAPTFKEIVSELEEFLGDADLAGYNSNKFDIPVLAEELLRVGSLFDISTRRFIDVQNIFHKMEQRTLAAAYKFYCEKDLENAHSALADIEATHEVFLAQLGRYESLEKDIDFLADFSRQGDNALLDFAGRIAKNEDGEAMYNFGKHKGKTIREVHEEEPGYYGWMLGANFPLYTKQVLRAEFEKIKKDLNDSNEKTTKVVVKKPSNTKLASKPSSEENLQDKLAELQAKFGKK